MDTQAIIITASVIVRRPNCRDNNGSCNYMQGDGLLCKLFFEDSVRDRNTGVIKPHAQCREAENCGY